MPELRRFAPDVPVVLVGTKLGIICFLVSYLYFSYNQDFLKTKHIIKKPFLVFLHVDLRDDKGYLADHSGSNPITYAQVLLNHQSSNFNIQTH